MRQKRELDEIDLRIIQLLAEDSRRAFSEIADHVGLSPPAVSDRIERLQQQEIIRGFTVDIDRLKLQDRMPVLVELQVTPPHGEAVYQSVRSLPGIEHVFKTHEGSITAHGNAPDNDLSSWLHSGVEMEYVSELSIKHLDKHTWNINLDDSEFSLTCVVCGNSVDSGGLTTDVGGETKAFCCPSCHSEYEQEYERRRTDRS